jgi:hypothetical protein
MKSPHFANRHASTLALLGAMALVFAYLLHRTLGLNPSIFADEWFYSKMSRLSPLSEAMVPSYLYLWIFGATNACGDGFFDCVKIGNALFFVGAAPFVYLVARHVLKRWMAWFVTLLSMLAPLGLFTNFFMPEATYYFGFWVLTWIVLTRTNWRWSQLALASGAVLGLMSLVKVHALFLLPALCLFLLYANWQREQPGQRLRNGLLAMCVAALTMIVVKFGLGYLLAGNAGLSLFGSFYAAGANSAASHSVLTLLSPALVNGSGHLMALALLLGLPLAVIVFAVASADARAQAGARLSLLYGYTLLMLGAAVGMTILYTASIADWGPTEVIRLHMRYYDFAFPLLFIIAAAQAGDVAPAGRAALKWLVALLLAALIVAAVIKLPTYWLAITDAPDIASIDFTLWWGPALAGLNVLILLLWASRSKLAAPLFLFVALPGLVALSIDGTQLYLSRLKPPAPGDEAGRFAHRTIPRSDHKDVTVVGTGMSELYRAQFHLDHAEAALLDLPPDAAIESYQVPVHGKWLLVVGNHALPPTLKPVIATASYKLVRLAPRERRGVVAQMEDPTASGLVAGVEGLSHAEGWGRWSDSKQVVVRFSAPLPRHLTVILTARAFGVNTTLPFTMRVGGERASFRLGGNMQEIALDFETDGTVRELAIEVPRPVSPTSLGHAGDDRALGMAMAAIQIDRREPVVASAD